MMIAPMIDCGREKLTVLSFDTIPVSTDPNNPTHLPDITLGQSTSKRFQVITALDGSKWIKNTGTSSIILQGDSMWQILQGNGSKAQFVLWSQSSIDDGVTIDEVNFSLREKSVANDANTSWSVPSGAFPWAPNQCIRWVMYNAGAGTLTLAAPSRIVDNGKTVAGLTLYQTLEEVG